MSAFLNRKHFGSFLLGFFFIVLIAVGVFLTRPSHKPESMRSDGENAVTGQAAVEIESEPAFETVVVPLPVPDSMEIVPASPKPAVLQNGHSISEMAATFQSTPKETPMTIKTLLEDDKTTDSPSAADEETAEPALPPSNSQWIPFVYFYRPSPYCNAPGTMYFYFPTCKKTAAIGTPPRGACPMPPAVVWNPYPMMRQNDFLFPAPGFAVPRKTVYPNGVVVKPKVYVPGRPLRNALRAVTP